MASQKGLGKGLGALLGDFSEEISEKSPYQLLPIYKVEPNPGQPRQDFDEVELQALADSISQHGIVQPLTVRQLSSGYYQIIAGERRWRAARAAGLTEVPVRIIEADDKRAMELALVENLQREDLNPIEEARGYRTLMEEYGLTQEETSAAVGKSRPAVANALRLLSLSAPVLAMVEGGKLSAGHARAITSLSGEALQLEAAQAILDRHLSVRQAEALAARLSKAAPEEETPADSQRVVVDYVREVERELENALGRKVKLVDGKKKGRLEIEFYGAEDREKLIENLKLFSSLRRNK